MRVYIAAPYFARDALRNYEFELQARGHESTATWLGASHEIDINALGTAPGASDSYAMDHALQDYEDVSRSDALILVTWDRAVGMCPVGTVYGPNSGGRHVEAGMALAQGIPVIVFGEPENIFHRGGLAIGLHVLPTWEEVVKGIDELQAARFGRLPLPGTSVLGSVSTGLD